MKEFYRVSPSREWSFGVWLKRDSWVMERSVAGVYETRKHWGEDKGLPRCKMCLGSTGRKEMEQALKFISKDGSMS